MTDDTSDTLQEGMGGRRGWRGVGKKERKGDEGEVDTHYDLNAALFKKIAREPPTMFAQQLCAILWINPLSPKKK